MEKDDIQTLRLMGEIEQDGNHSQRELSRKLNISLGLVNSFLKRLVSKGYFKATTMPRNRVKYFLTPQGLAKKSKLTVKYLRYSVNFYKEIKHLLLEKYHSLEENNVHSIIFFGAGEVAELAYLYLQLTEIQLRGMVDNQMENEKFFEFAIEGIERLNQPDWDVILLTRLSNVDQDIQFLLNHNVKANRIITL